MYIPKAHPLEIPEWSPQYTVKGVLTHSNGKIVEPFEAWYDWFAGISRVDYYGGIVTMFQFSNEGEFGRFYRMIPITTIRPLNKNARKCEKLDVRLNAFDENSNNFQRIHPQSVLPNLDDFDYNGELVKDLKCFNLL